MAVSPSTGDSTIAEVKAISAGYPFYGTLVVNPPVALTNETAHVGADLLDQLNLKVGDSIKVGTSLFQISGVVEHEPDRIAAGLNLAPRVTLSQCGLQRAGLIQVGSLANAWAAHWMWCESNLGRFCATNERPVWPD